MKNRYLKNLIYVFVFCFGLSLISSCHKKDTESYKLSAEDNSLCENMFNEVFRIAYDVMQSDPTMTYFSSAVIPCAVITQNTLQPDSFPRIITIDFGTGACVGTDARTRTGKMIITLLDTFNTANKDIKISYNGFKIDGTTIAGQTTIIYNGIVAGNPVFRLKVSSANLVDYNGKNLTWTADRTFELFEGKNTPWPVIEDDSFLISGSGSGTNTSGSLFNFALTKSQIFNLNCKWPESGTMDIAPGDLDNQSLDYGFGGCDVKAVLTIKEDPYDIVLR